MLLVVVLLSVVLLASVLLLPGVGFILQAGSQVTHILNMGGRVGR